MKNLILAIDQGTTGTTVLILDDKLHTLAKKNSEFKQHYPKPGWVEHDTGEIWHSVTKTIGDALAGSNIAGNRIACMGITNQRETTCMWVKKNSTPIHKAIVWQDRRTADICKELKAAGKEELFRQRTGLVLDPYFSGTKIKWLLDHVAGARDAANRGELAFGTIDTFLVWQLTNGKSHVTDVSNASRTLLMNLESLAWDKELCSALDVPQSILPQICPSSHPFGTTQNVPGLPDGIPILGIAGDQQAALFGQACFDAGESKCTYGTGSFLLMNVGPRPIISEQGLLSSVGWKIGNKTTYCLEGSSFIAGAAVQWLRDELKIIDSAPEVEKLAKSVADNGGVYFVPAFAGLGAPYWNPEARGVIWGLTRGSNRGHIARACLEGIAFQQMEILASMQKDAGKNCNILKVDGGAAANNLLMQFQADILGVKIVRPKMLETTALGAAFLAGLQAGIWKDQEEIRKSWQEDRTFTPTFTDDQRNEVQKRWQAVVAKA